MHSCMKNTSVHLCSPFTFSPFGKNFPLPERFPDSLSVRLFLPSRFHSVPSSTLFFFLPSVPLSDSAIVFYLIFCSFLSGRDEYFFSLFLCFSSRTMISRGKKTSHPFLLPERKSPGMEKQKGKDWECRGNRGKVGLLCPGKQQEKCGKETPWRKNVRCKKRTGT